MPMFGGETSREDHQHHRRDHTDAVIDPALRSVPSSPGPDKRKDSSSVNQEMSSPRRQLQQHYETSVHRHPSPPPPITTMSNSPSPSVVSVDRSSNSTPQIRRSPPMPPPAIYSNSYQHDPPMIPSANRHHYSRPDQMPHPAYIYQPPPNFDHQPRYDQQHHDRSYQTPSGLPHFAVPPMSHPQQHPGSMHAYDPRYPVPGSQPQVPTVLTDDAATKLTDGIRRRCFNCCTTDTSTWRRSNLSPGKVLCNKCGLFERTHSRPRPDQFPHKRGPLAGATLRGRTPPNNNGNSNNLPPISGPPGGSYQYHHQPITPLNAPGDYHHHHQQHPPPPPSSSNNNNTLPGLSWHPDHHGHHNGTHANGGSSSGGAHTQSGGSGGGGGGGSGPSSTAANGGESHHHHHSSSSGGSNHSNSNSATGTPQLTSRRATLESPRLLSSASQSSPRLRYEESQSQSQTSSSSVGGDRAPSPITRNSSHSQSHSHHQETSSHTPPPPPPPAGPARESAAV